MVKLSFMGGTHEVGRNAILLETGNGRVLLDYGVKIGKKPEFPAHIRARDIDGIMLSHAHLDHSGGIPLFYLRGQIPFFATPPTMDLISVLIKDMIKLSGYFLPFEYIEYESMMKQRQFLSYGRDVSLKDIDFRFSNAGHIPGSAMIEINANGKRILYTGDLNTTKTRLVQDARIPRQRLDAIIIESTYATTEHEDRKKIEEDFVRAVKDVRRLDGKVLVPAFAVGRSQEILSVLNAHKVNALTIVDGMARAVNKILIDHPDYIKTPRTFERVINTTQEIRGWRDRRQALRKANVIVAPSGMLQGGTAIFYMERIALQQNNAVFLVSYQVPGTGGAKLLETGYFTIRERDERVMASIKHFDFSSHCGKSQLEAFLRGLKGNPDVYVIHGEPESCNALAQWARDELDLNAVAPNQEDEFQV
jgi:putative mRNA 3-end processing factor